VLEPLEQLLQHRRRQFLALIGGVFVVLRWGLERLGRSLLYYYCFTDTLLMLGEESPRAAFFLRDKCFTTSLLHLGEEIRTRVFLAYLFSSEGANVEKPCAHATPVHVVY
jgi:hypothetical protein